ncbi:hypothetical protein AAVH_17577 [Aphelenchoides avenae]|nr:hypothetical protein AAVH_17577 [Aphelenchus avenae]
MYWTMALVFVLLMVLAFPFALLEAAEALSARQEASRPIERGFTAAISVAHVCKIRCAERASDKCHLERDFKDEIQKWARTTVSCDAGIQRDAPRTNTQLYRWKDLAALLVVWMPMLCLPTMALLRPTFGCRAA